MKKYASIRIKIAIAFGFAAFSFSAYGQDFCAYLFTQMESKVVSLDAEFSNLLEENLPVEKKTPKVTTLLNRALFPMAEQFSARVQARSKSEIQQSLNALNPRFPIYQSAYTSGSDRKAYLNKFGLSTDELNQAQATIDHNARQAKSFYGIQNLPQTYLHKNFLYVDFPTDRIPKLGILHKQLGLIITPIGEYGPEFAARMLRTTQLLAKYAESDLAGLSTEIFGGNSHLLTAESARGKGAYSESAQPDQTPVSAFIEGLMTYHQLVNIMLAEKIPGLESGEQALKAFVHSGSGHMGLTAGLTARIPIGMTGPMSISGFGYKNALRLNAEGKLEPTEEMKETLGKLMDIHAKRQHRGVCPMASFFRGRSQAPSQNDPVARKAGLQLIAEAYWHVFQQVSRIEMSSALLTLDLVKQAAKQGLPKGIDFDDVITWAKTQTASSSLQEVMEIHEALLNLAKTPAEIRKALTPLVQPSSAYQAKMASFAMDSMNVPKVRKAIAHDATFLLEFERLAYDIEYSIKLKTMALEQASTMEEADRILAFAFEVPSEAYRTRVEALRKATFVRLSASQSTEKTIAYIREQNASERIPLWNHMLEKVSNREDFYRVIRAIKSLDETRFDARLWLEKNVELMRRLRLDTVDYNFVRHSFGLPRISDLDSPLRGTRH